MIKVGVKDATLKLNVIHYSGGRQDIQNQNLKFATRLKHGVIEMPANKNKYSY